MFQKGPRTLEMRIIFVPMKNCELPRRSEKIENDRMDNSRFWRFDWSIFTKEKFFFENCGKQEFIEKNSLDFLFDLTEKILISLLKPERINLKNFVSFFRLHNSYKSGS